MSYIRWLHEQEAQRPGLVGGKAINLSRLAGAGFPVPPGFCITATAYRYLLEVTGLAPIIASLLRDVDFADSETVARQAAAIRNLIAQQPIPTAIAEEIVESYHRLATNLQLADDRRLAVAIRSSATAEDLPGASFAGQQDTYLNIRGSSAVVEHVRLCWASLWTDRALTYRHNQGFDHNKVYVAVIVQAMIEARTSGILFTANPVSGCRDECVINSSWGLGEAVVCGLVTPDTYVVNKRDGRVMQRHIAKKERMIISAQNGGAQEVDTASAQKALPALDDRQVASLTALCSRIETFYDAPQDIEWAHDGQRWYILQARPITTLRKTDQEMTFDGRYSRAMFHEIFPEGLSPAFLSVLCPLLSGMLVYTFKRLGFQPPPPDTAVIAFRNQPYLSIDYIEEALSALPPAVRAETAARFTNVFDHENADGKLTMAHLGLMRGMLGFLRQFHRQLPAQLEAHQALIDRANILAVAEASAEDLLATIREVSFQVAGPLLNNDFLLIATIGTFTRLMNRLLEPTYGDSAPEVTNMLITAVSGNVIMETNALIWDLAQTARGDQELCALLRSTEPQDFLARLPDSLAARKFQAQLDDLLQICGHREMALDVLYPTWGEDPAPVIAFVRGYLDASADHDPRLRAQEMLAQRQKLTRKTMRDISGSLQGRVLRRPMLAWLLPRTQRLARERDTMHFEWTRIFPVVRRMLLELADRWINQRLLSAPDDVFYLSLEEMDDLVKTPRSCHDLIRRRRAELRANLHGPWPDVLGGTLPQGTTAAGQPAEADGSQLRGIASSPGLATGPVRIINGPQDFARLCAGDILVAPLTNPVWTPLFAIARGVVTEVGGILSHGAIVAREYGIPAVMSVPGATSALQDGQIVVVDGDRGLVSTGHAQLAALGLHNERTISPNLA